MLILFMEEKGMKHDELVKLVLASVFAALCCVATMLIHIPIPATNGYVNLGDCVVLLGALMLGPLYGMAAGGIGSMLADLLLGYAAYAPGTLVIKGLMALCAALVFRALRGKSRFAVTVGALTGELIMVIGYFAFESTVLGYGLAAAASIPANAIQGVGGMLAGVVAYHALSAVPYIKKLI